MLFVPKDVLSIHYTYTYFVVPFVGTTVRRVHIEFKNSFTCSVNHTILKLGDISYKATHSSN